MPRISAAQAAELGRRLSAELADEVFWCETCGRTHPLAEHKACREGA